MPVTVEVCGELICVADKTVEKLPTLVELLADLPADCEDVVPIPLLSAREFRNVIEHVVLERPLALQDERAAAYLGLGVGSVRIEADEDKVLTILPRLKTLEALSSLKSPHGDGHPVVLLDKLEPEEIAITYADISTGGLRQAAFDADKYTQLAVQGLLQYRTQWMDSADALINGLPLNLLNYHLSRHPLPIGRCRDLSSYNLPFDTSLLDRFDAVSVRIKRLSQYPRCPTLHYYLRGIEFDKYVRISGRGQVRLYIYGISAMGRCLPDDAIASITLEWSDLEYYKSDDGVTVVHPTFLQDIYLAARGTLTIRPSVTYTNVRLFLVVATPRTIENGHYLDQPNYFRVDTDLDTK